MAVKKFVFCVLFFTNAINSAEKDDSDNKKFSISTVERDSSIPKNNYNTRKWGSIYLLFNPITHFVDYYSEYTWLTFFRIFTGDILYRYISKKGVGVMLKLGFNSSFISISKNTSIRLSPSLTLSFCWVYKKNGIKMFSGSFCPVGIGLGNINNKTSFSKKSYFILFLNISYLHYENGKGFFLSWGKFNMVYWKKLRESIVNNILISLGHLELGFSLLKSKHKKKY